MSKRDSSIIKGILTILIVIGHNHIIAPQSSPLMSYLYTFHVVCFFILPWMYNNKKELTWKNIGTIIFRNWIPYIFFFVLSLCVFNIIEGKHINIEGASFAFISGSQRLLKENVGFFFLWFLPTFCTFSILKVLGEKWRLIQIAVLFLSIVSFLLSWEQTEWLKNNLLFGLYVAIRYYVYGILIYYLISWKEWTKYIGAIVFIILSLLYWNGNINWYGIVSMPITGFMFILSVLPAVRMNWLKAIGEYSLPIYLTHVYIYNAIELIIPNNMWYGIIALVSTLAISYTFSAVVFKIPSIRKIIFPRDFKEWKEVFCAAHN